MTPCLKWATRGVPRVGVGNAMHSKILRTDGSSSWDPALANLASMKEVKWSIRRGTIGRNENVILQGAADFCSPYMFKVYIVISVHTVSITLCQVFVTCYSTTLCYYM